VVYACSSNSGKLREFEVASRSAAATGYRIVPLPNLRNIAPPEETGKTFEENAVLKATYYSSFSDELVFADDSGLEVDALEGAPGVFSARFAGENATDEDNNSLLLKRLSGVRERTAAFVCAIALARAGVILGVFHGRTEGRILDEKQGAGGFGYDPLFYYQPFEKTLAELTREEKLGVSHRGQAIREMVKYLATARG
jgi:XTP/dITP diphosphohydrolase